jgi:hypothetical protein
MGVVFQHAPSATSKDGEVWRRQDDREEDTAFSAGVSLTIRAGTHSQFRDMGDAPLRFVVATMLPWPGATEAVGFDESFCRIMTLLVRVGAEVSPTAPSRRKGVAGCVHQYCYCLACVQVTINL